jgi:micrococcal nuclease
MSRRAKKRLIAALLALVVLLVSNRFELQVRQQLPANLQPGTYHVTYVDDGDTIVVDMNSTEEKVRMIGVDTPETKDPRKPVQCFGHAAAEFTKNLIGDNPVRLEADPTNTNRDRYDRLLRYVYLPDGRLVNAEIIRAGYGFAYVSFPVQKLEEFRSLEREAREQNRGLWAGCEPQPNEYGGFDSNPEGL